MGGPQRGAPSPGAAGGKKEPAAPVRGGHSGGGPPDPFPPCFLLVSGCGGHRRLCSPGLPAGGAGSAESPGEKEQGTELEQGGGRNPRAGGCGMVLADCPHGTVRGTVLSAGSAGT